MLANHDRLVYYITRRILNIYMVRYSRHIVYMYH